MARFAKTVLSRRKPAGARGHDIGCARSVAATIFLAFSVFVSGCLDETEERQIDNEPIDGDQGDTEDTDTGADAGDTDTDWMTNPSGIRGYVKIGNPWEGVIVSAGNLGTNTGGGATHTDVDGYYEIELPSGAYSVSALYFMSNGAECWDGLTPVIVSTGLWVEVDLDLVCEDVD